MKVLIVSFYYRPDLCAGSFRATSLVNALEKTLPPNAEIEVLTTMPNRYQTYELKAENVEVDDRVTIRRFPIPSHKSGMLDQARSFLSFAKHVSGYCKNLEVNFIVATSSRLMTAALGAYISKKKSIGLYLDIRDIFVDTMDNILPKAKFFVLKPIMNLIESYTMKSAVKINLVSKGFEPYFLERYPKQRYSFFTNGIDDEFISIEKQDQLSTCDVKDSAQDTQPSDTGPLTVLYAGNIGEGQGLHEIVPKVAKMMKRELIFRIIGDGGKKDKLIEEIRKFDCTNVEILKPMDRKSLIEEYLCADVLFLHLNAYDAFLKVLPSKIFEYAALGKPVWAGVAGFSSQFIQKEVQNAAVFEPCNAEQALSSFRTLEIKTEERIDFNNEFSRKAIMKAMANDITSEILGY